MEIKFNISKSFSETSISINSSHKNDNLILAAKAIDNIINQEILIGYQNEKRTVIPLYQIISIHTDNKNIICETQYNTYRLNKRIYEMKELLPSALFLQLSNSEIVNISQIKEFNLTKSGNYQVNLLNGTVTYTSRRYAQLIRKELLKWKK